MEKQVAEIDNNGYFIRDVIIDDESIVDFSYIELRPDTELQAFYRPKWTGTEWVEGMSQEEINTVNNVIQEPTLEERLASIEEVMMMLI